MKKSLLILLVSLAMAPIADCGISLCGIPGKLTFDSLGPGKSRAIVKTASKQERAVPGIAHPGNVKHGFQPAGATAHNYKQEPEPHT